MTGQKAFEQIAKFSDRHNADKGKQISLEDFELWQKDVIWDALHGIRYGQSFCNRFGIQDNHLYYNTGDVKWTDEYIKKTYLERI